MTDTPLDEVDKSLDEAEEAFVFAYLEHRFCASKAAQAAYAVKPGPSAWAKGSMVKARPHVAAAIRRCLDAMALSAKEALALMADEARHGEGMSRVKALELIGREHGLFAPPSKVEVSGPAGAPVQFSVDAAIRQTLGRDHDLDEDHDGGELGP